MKRMLSSAALALSCFAANPAFAAYGYLTSNVDLRAGPDSSYPSVVSLSAGTAVAIEGCVDGWSWCDVAAGDDRGWVDGSFLQEEYQGQRVLVREYGVQIGIPVVTFVFGTYWDNHYRNSSWYGERERWSRVTPHYRPAATGSGSGVSAARPSDQGRTSKAVETRHPVAMEARTPVPHSNTPKAAEHNMTEPKAAAEQHAAVQQQPKPPAQPKAITEHKAVTQKAPPKGTVVKPPEPGSGKDQDQR